MTTASSKEDGMRSILFAGLILFSSMTGVAMAQDKSVLEIVTMNLKDGISADDFAAVDKAIEEQHVSKQPGFVSRETAVSGRKWLVIVHWTSTDSAQASMDSFASAPAASQFMSMIDASTMTMTRYDVVR